MDKLDFDKLTPTWFVHFFKTLREGGISTEKVVSIFDRLSVISFNYDRSLEHFLVQAMCTYYTISEPEAEGILQKLGIFHPYGTVGPWCEGCDHQPFGKVRNSPQELLRLAQRIHTYTESSVHSEEVKRTVSKAEVIIFLGFGYISENLKLLRPRDEHARSTRQIYGTAYGLSKPNKVIITSALSSFLAPRLGARVPGAQPSVDLFNGKCAALFDEYSFAMTSR